MWAAAAQPRLALAPMIPTPNVDAAAVTSASSSSSAPGKQSPCSGDRGLACRDGVHRQFDPRRLADEDAAGLQGDVPGEPEVFAVDLGGRAEPDARTGGPRIPSRATPDRTPTNTRTTRPCDTPRRR